LCREFKTKYELTAEALLIKLTSNQPSLLWLSLPIAGLSLHVTIQKQQAVYTAS